MKASGSARLRALAVVPLLATLVVPLAAASATATPTDPATTTESSAPADLPIDATVIEVADYSDLPDPTDRGTYTPATIQETKLGLVDLQEPNSAGQAPTAAAAQRPESMQIRGALYYPADRDEPSPVIVLVHGNHGSCDSGQNAAAMSCAEFKRNEAGYAYLGENLATWGYTVFSVSQDQLMMRQDNAKGKGMHQRRLMIAGALDALTAANAPGGLPLDVNTTIGDTLSGRLDMTRIGLMGHSRGGDAVTSFIDYNRIRTDGPRYPLRGVISLAPVDYERKAPYGTPYLSILPWCDGDVSNLQGARFFERGQYVNGEDPFPLIQSSQLGANHNWYNTVWFADGQDGGNVQDAACGNSAPSSANNVQPNNLRLSGAASLDPWSYVIDNSDTFNPLVNTKISGDPDRMGDQETIGLASMAAFFRRYVGGEGAFEPYMTGELSTTDSHLQIPESACPTSESGARIGCEERVSTSYFPPADERVDVIRPEIDNPLSLNALGGELTGSGFVYPYLDNGGVTLPAATTQGFDWCNPEPDHFAPGQLGLSSQPTAAKACPLPGKAELGGQNAMRENSPVNHSYGRQLAVAWEASSPAVMTAAVPAASQDVSGLKALALGADVNYFDTRNPGATRFDESGAPLPVTYDPAATTQDFVISLVDTDGNEGTVKAGDERWGNALHMSTGTQTSRMHIVLDQIRVPLTEFAAQGVDLTSIDRLELRFGVDGTPASGSIQLADVRFQEAAVAEPLILSDGVEPDAGAGYGPPATGPDPADLLEAYDNTPGNVTLVDTVGNPASNTSWVVDDDRVQCPNASFTSIQAAVDHASPWDTIVVCEGTYAERSTPVNGQGNPVAAGSLNGLTITKPLRIKGAGADKVTIMPDQSLTTLAGGTPYLRDGGGNVITISRQSLGSTDTNEMFVDISGVTVTSGNVFAEAGIAYFGAAGRVSESVVGPLRTATTPEELAANPHGWGIVKTGVIQGSGRGTVETELTVKDSQVLGYQSGGILVDGGWGTDAAATTNQRSGIRNHGYVSGTVVTGTLNASFPQTGVAFTGGSDGFVENSRITGNYFQSAPERSFGLLLKDAGNGSLVARGSVFSGNGFSVYNANPDASGVREQAPFTVEGSFLGTGALVVGGPAVPASNREAISGTDAAGAQTVLVRQRVTTPPAGVPTTAGSPVDAAPVASVVDPLDGVVVEAGDVVAPLVRASDDHAVASATLLVDGEPHATATISPYRFSWTAEESRKGTDVELRALVVDSAGQETLSDPITVTVAADEPVVTAFVDVPLGSMFYTEIAWLAEAGISTGWELPDGTREFRPVTPIARDAMAAFLFRMKAPAGYVAPDVSPFVDVPTTSQFYTEIAWLAEEGISTGWERPDGTREYRPLDNVARDAMAAFLYRIAGSPSYEIPTVTPFWDVPTTNAFYTEIAWAASTGVSTGWQGNDGTAEYKPLNPINRDAMAAFLSRFSKLG
ncbi:alpha/beta hydrolase [Serinibacter arcticus]|uniref:Alpha/beta hydrolase n=1 Tax=Serinibacter arcticus TaxID=1655435 RepID=A0A2U1ZXF8_9MICO|nr:Ig-like domain-containing protein [Serinibacter arcticus]PWD51623.1 alpha/beta hydrolase [Serinibacter arcticus]